MSGRGSGRAGVRVRVPVRVPVRVGEMGRAGGWGSSGTRKQLLENLAPTIIIPTRLYRNPPCPFLGTWTLREIKSWFLLPK